MSVPSKKPVDTYLLKNGMQVYHLNEYETEFLYRELFENRVYLKHDIRLTNESVVVDVGANIGLFAVFLQHEFPGCRLVLVEPSPVLCEIIRANTQSFVKNVAVVQAGLSDTRKTGEFTFYSGYSMISGFKADPGKDADFLRCGIVNQLSRLKLPPEREEELIAALMEGKLDDPRKCSIALMSLDDLIEEQDLSRIDLLKIDAEGCESEILKGISPINWPKIRQIVIEVHESQGFGVGEIVALLEMKNFRVFVEQENNFRSTGIYNLYAHRS